MFRVERLIGDEFYMHLLRLRWVRARCGGAEKNGCNREKIERSLCLELLGGGNLMNAEAGAGGAPHPFEGEGHGVTSSLPRSCSRWANCTAL